MRKEPFDRIAKVEVLASSFLYLAVGESPSAYRKDPDFNFFVKHITIDDLIEQS